MKKYFLITFIIAFSYMNAAMQTKTIYLIPGQGSDYRLFQNLELDSIYNLKYIHYVVPDKMDDMYTYSKKLAEQIDTTENFAIVGVSLGGMLALEMEKYLNPTEIILISSAKDKTELPKLYRFFKHMPLYKVFGGNFFKQWTYMLQPLFEPLDKENQELWRSMLLKKDKLFMKTMLKCIIEWDRPPSKTNARFIQFHGEKDRTLPLRNIKNPITVKDGTHIMTLLSAEYLSKEISKFLQ